MTENGVLISLKNVSVFYDGKAVISGVSADIFRGERFCILGESGGGKTTLLNILSGLVSPDEGEITYADGAAPRCSGSFFIAEFNRFEESDVCRRRKDVLRKTACARGACR